MSANRDCRNVYPHLARFEGDVDTSDPCRLPALPHRVWARRDSTLEDMKRFTTPHPLRCILQLVELAQNVTSVAPVVDTQGPRSHPAHDFLTMTRKADCCVPTEITCSVPSVKRAVFRNPERLPFVRTLPMFPSLTCRVFRTDTERGKRPDPLSRDRSAEWRS
jgi:hypothetical protein